MLSRAFYELTRCLHTGTPLRLAEPPTLDRLNQAIAAGRVKNGRGEPVAQVLDAALVNETMEVAYPVIQEIPVLLRDEAIDMRQLTQLHDSTEGETGDE